MQDYEATTEPSNMPAEVTEATMLHVHRVEASCQTDLGGSVLALADDVIGLAGEVAALRYERDTGIAVEEAPVHEVEEIAVAEVAAPDAVADVVPNIVADAASDVVEDAAPEVAPAVAPDVAADAAPDADPDDGPNAEEEIPLEYSPEMHLRALGSAARRPLLSSSVLPATVREEEDAVEYTEQQEDDGVDCSARENDDALDYGGFGGAPCSPFTPHSFTPRSSLSGQPDSGSDYTVHPYTELPDSPMPETSPQVRTAVHAVAADAAAAQEAATRTAEAEAVDVVSTKHATREECMSVTEVVTQATCSRAEDRISLAEEPAWLADAAVSLSTSASTTVLQSRRTVAAPTLVASTADPKPSAADNIGFTTNSLASAQPTASMASTGTSDEFALFLKNDFHQEGLAEAAQAAAALLEIPAPEEARHHVQEVQEAVMSTLRKVELACDHAVAESEEQARMVLQQLEQRAELLADRERELTEMEARRRSHDLATIGSRIGIAQQLITRRSLAASRRALLVQCWRSLCLNAAARQMVADRARLTEIIMQQANGQLRDGVTEIALPERPIQAQARRRGDDAGAGWHQALRSAVGCLQTQRA